MKIPDYWEQAKLELAERDAVMRSLVVRFRGEGLGDNVSVTDPLSTGLHTLEPEAGDAAPLLAPKPL